MNWNLEKIKFLYPPDDFVGSFANELMQARHKSLQEEKINKIMSDLADADNPLSAMEKLHERDQMQFLQNNLSGFKAKKCLEEAVLKLYYRQNSAFVAVGIFDVWSDLFTQCDQQRFFSLGLPFPTKSIPAFRGSVTGIEKGFCWTISNKTLDWFIERWHDKELGGGTIFTTNICQKDILIHLKTEEKDEVIVSPQFLETAKILPIKVDS